MPLMYADSDGYVAPPKKKPEEEALPKPPGFTPAAQYQYADSPIPGVDPFRLAQASDAFRRAQNDINQRRLGMLTDAGFRAKGFDEATGMATDVEVDPTSMYGGFQQMLDQQARQSMAAEEEGAGRGFTGGLANQAASRLRYEHGGQSRQFGSALTRALSGLSQDWLGAKNTYNDTLWQAKLDAARMAIDAGQFTPVGAIGDDTNGAATDDFVASQTPAAVARAKTLAKKLTPAENALHVRSVALNKKYGLGPDPAEKALAARSKALNKKHNLGRR